MYCLELLRYSLFALFLSLLAACGGGGGGDGNGGTTASTPTTLSGPSIAGDNVVSLSVGPGPVSGLYQVNRLYASVTVCAPGTSNCATIDDVLVDTGSTGLRLLASSLPGSLALGASTSPPTVACQQYLDGSFSWGPVVQADVVLGDMGIKKASNLPIQVIADPAYSALKSNCSGSGDSLETLSDLGASGILGVGMNVEDCGSYCTTFANNGYYFTCSTSTCAGRTVPLAAQLQNPVARVSNDNNGVTIVLPAIVTSSVTTLTNGSMLLGIGTQANNQAQGVALLNAASNTGYITTTGSFGNRAKSFLDTGSNALFFDDTSIPQCASAPGFYCPLSTRSYTATLTGTNSVSATVNFSIVNASSIFATRDHAIPNLGGPVNNNTIFDWGLPFFFGRTVFIGIEGRNATVNSGLATGPFYAF